MDGSMVFGVWLGYLLLLIFADPMFPQLFQRFMAARNARALRTTAVLYPLATTFLFFLTVSIGVMGRAALPGLSAAQSDNVFPLLLQHYLGGALATLLLTAGMAALMSTLDSQLLTLSSMITLDFIPVRRREVLVQRLTLAVLGMLGFLIALKPPQTILDFINRTSFYGFSVLAPPVVGGLYWKGATKHGAVASILVGETLVVAFYFKLLKWPGVLPVIPIVITTSIAFVIVSLITSQKGGDTSSVAALSKGIWPWGVVFLVLFLLGNDYWAWNRTPFLVLGALLSAVFAFYARRSAKKEALTR